MAFSEYMNKRGAPQKEVSENYQPLSSSSSSSPSFLSSSVLTEFSLAEVSDFSLEADSDLLFMNASASASVTSTILLSSPKKDFQTEL